MKKISYLILFIFAVLAGRNYYKEWYVAETLNKNISSSRNRIDLREDQDRLQRGHVIVPTAPYPLTENWIREYIQNNLYDKTDYYYTWRWYSESPVTASALGLDGLHHFANSYLMGFAPFKTDSVWEPVYAVALMKTYQYDNLQYSGLTDVWQNAHQAFYFPRGDCEDHSIVLADWLISSGYDARVAVGMCSGNGHAWVILIKEGAAYLIEATSKRKQITNKLRPAFLETDYNPFYQFNQTDFWVKTDPKQTTRYTGPHWKKASVFVKDFF